MHAKLAIIDDDVLRIGSTNLNSRSSGFDTECDVTLEAAGPGAAVIRRQIRGVRDRLVGHWMDASPRQVEAAMAKAEGLGAAIALLQAGGPPRMKALQSQSLGPLATFVAAHHIGDPIGPEDSWRPWRRRADMAKRLAQQKRILARAGLNPPKVVKIKEVV